MQKAVEEFVVLVEQAAKARREPEIPRHFILKALGKIERGEEKVENWYPLSGFPGLKDTYDFAAKLYAETKNKEKMAIQVDYTVEGEGKFVGLIFPDGYKEENPGVPAKSLIEAINIDKVGHVWGNIKILEFLWTPELDKAKVSKAINAFKEKYPGLEVQFTSDTCLRM